MRPVLGGLACASLLVALLAPGVLAARPDVWRDTYVLDLDAPFISAACGFTVHRHEVGKYTGQDFEDGSSVIHGQLTTSWTANGRTAYEHDDFTTIYDPETGTQVIAGTWYHVTGPAVGAIQLDNGLLVYDADGDLIFSAGPAPSNARDVDALCAYLAGSGTADLIALAMDRQRTRAMPAQPTGMTIRASSAMAAKSRVR